MLVLETLDLKQIQDPSSLNAPRQNDKQTNSKCKGELNVKYSKKTTYPYLLRRLGTLLFPQLHSRRPLSRPAGAGSGGTSGGGSNGRRRRDRSFLLWSRLGSCLLGSSFLLGGLKSRMSEFECPKL